MKFRTPSGLIYTLLFTLLIGISSIVQAACLQSDLTGTWYAYSIGTYCKLVLNSTGAFTTTTSSCVVKVPDYDTGEILTYLYRVKGTMKINSSCALSKAYIYFYDYNTSVYTGSYSTINKGSLDRGKSVLLTLVDDLLNISAVRF